MNTNSFLTVLGKIVGAIDAVPPGIKQAITIIPGVGTPFQVAFQAAAALDKIFPASRQGPLKLPLAVQTLITAHPGIDQAKATASMSKMVGALNMLQQAQTELDALAAPVKAVPVAVVAPPAPAPVQASTPVPATPITLVTPTPAVAELTRDGITTVRVTTLPVAKP